MNDNTWLSLQNHVDQVLASIPASARRKRRMREEMAAHLLSLYEEELARLHDEQQALDHAVHRFGAIDVLRDELKTCVPVLERVLYLFLGKKENVMHWVFTILGFLTVLVGFGFICPALQQMRFYEVMPLTIFLLTLGIVLAASGVWSMVHGIQRYRVRQT